MRLRQPAADTRGDQLGTLQAVQVTIVGRPADSMTDAESHERTAANDSERDRLERRGSQFAPNGLTQPARYDRIPKTAAAQRFKCRRQRYANAVSIFATLLGIPKLDGANCAGQWSLFDEPERGDPARRAVVDSALRLCATCPALADCAAWYDRLPVDEKPTGVVAGRLRRYAIRPARQAA